MTVRNIINAALIKFYTKLNKKVLTTLEEIEANTDSSNFAGATAVAELSNNLGGLYFYEDASGNKYAVGADAVPKKLGSSKKKITIKWYIIFYGASDKAYNATSTTYTNVYYSYNNKLYSDVNCTKQVSSISLTANLNINYVRVYDEILNTNIQYVISSIIISDV